MSDLTFYYGAASGQSRAALRRLDETNVMLNYATRDNEPWPGIRRLFIDSGGYSFMKGKGEYQTPPQAYARYIQRVRPEAWAFRDYPCEPDVLEAHDRTVAGHQRMTTEAAIELRDLAESRDLPGRPYPVVQGWEVDEYLDHLDDLRDHGLIDDCLAVGSVCGRKDVEQVRSILKAIASEAPDLDLHGFGVKRPAILGDDEVVGLLDSADSQAFVKRGMFASRNESRPFTWQECAYWYLRFKRRMQSVTREIGDAAAAPERNRSLTEFACPDGGTREGSQAGDRDE